MLTKTRFGSKKTAHREQIGALTKCDLLTVSIRDSEANVSVIVGYCKFCVCSDAELIETRNRVRSKD